MTKLTFSDFDITKNEAENYLKSTMIHIGNVRIAGDFLGVDAEQLEIHDASKFSVHEFPHNARRFFGNNDDPTGYAMSWLNHIHNNPHHWNHWVYPSQFNQVGDACENGCLPMPECFILEMVADWMGASMSYTSSWDMSDWLHTNLDKIKMHPVSKRELMIILGSVGYDISELRTVFLGKHPDTAFEFQELDYELVPKWDWWE